MDPPSTDDLRRWGVKRAPVSGERESFTLKGRRRASSACPSSLLTILREPLARSIGHFEQVRASAVNRKPREFRSGNRLAPQGRFELSTHWLTTGSLKRRGFPQRRGCGEPLLLGRVRLVVSALFRVRP
jgi:hypothetical protein